MHAFGMSRNSAVFGKESLALPIRIFRGTLILGGIVVVFVFKFFEEFSPQFYH